MCDITLPTALTIGSTLFSTYSSIQQGKYNKAVANNNAIIAEQKADDAIERGKEEERQHRLKVEALKGQQRSVLAANGVVLDDGSALDILADTAEQGELDALTIRHNAQREANDYRNSAGNYRAEGQMAAFEARSEATASIIGGAGSVAKKWYSPESKAGRMNKDLYGTANPNLDKYGNLM